MNNSKNYFNLSKISCSNLKDYSAPQLVNKCHTDVVIVLLLVIFLLCMLLPNTAHRNPAHQGRLVVAVQDVDEICDGQHACGWKEDLYWPWLISRYALHRRPTHPQTSATCCPTAARPSSHLQPVQRRPSSPWGSQRGLRFAVGFIKTWKLTRDSLAEWYQIWPVYSWLEWRRSNSGSSWSSCRPWRRPLPGDMVPPPHPAGE